LNNDLALFFVFFNA